jgi:PHD/YefM family antitoxin component YafN of YafNO toxin-antitoxin module
MNMKLKESVKPISFIKSHAAETLDYINDNRSPVIITQHGEARGVFIDVESYQQMVDALSLTSLIQVAEESLVAQGSKTHEEVFADTLAHRV